MLPNYSFQAGSLGKGTALKGNSDLDIVVFFNDFQTMSQFRKLNNTCKNDIIKAIKQWKHYRDGNVDILSQTRHAVKLRIRPTARDEFMDVDVLPSIDNLDMEKVSLQFLLH